jgi:methylated-DNA-protein-cysteine methyltransferase-like protein
MESTAYERIYAAVCRIPRGKVSTYGQVAKAAGYFRGARMVGWALRALPPDSDIPWQRVVGKGGILTIINPKLDKREQALRLAAEGISVEEPGGVPLLPEPPWFDFEQP